jgi:Icc-related predicted phosphoesterase
VAEPEECFAPSACMDAELRQVGPLADPWIFVCHAPPFATNLDRLPDLCQPIGSHAVRDFIERRRPLLSLHGHIHESPGVSGQFCDLLGDALCINPGQGRRLHAVLLDSDNPRASLRHTVME